MLVLLRLLFLNTHSPSRGILATPYCFHLFVYAHFSLKIINVLLHGVVRRLLLVSSILTRSPYSGFVLQLSEVNNYFRYNLDF